MMPVRLIFLVAFISVLFSSKAVFAQQEFVLTGAIIDNDNKVRVALAEVFNKRNGYSVGSSDMGLFKIRAVVGDTLLVVKRGFDDKKIVVTSSKDILVYVSRGVTLNEVVINGNSQRQTLDAIKKDFKDKGSFYSGKPPFLSFLFTPLTAIYEVFGRTPKNARRFSRYYDTELQQIHIDRFFNRTIIEEQTGLTGSELSNFMINYRPEYKEAKNWNIYDGNKYIKDSYQKYTDALAKKP